MHIYTAVRVLLEAEARSTRARQALPERQARAERGCQKLCVCVMLEASTSEAREV
jgi:hypothetical protein